MLDDRRSNSDGFELPAPTDEGEVDAGRTFNGGLTLDDGAGGVAGAPAPPLGCSNEKLILMKTATLRRNGR